MSNPEGGKLFLQYFVEAAVQESLIFNKKIV